MSDEEWDTGAETSFAQDKFNRFDASKTHELAGKEEKEVVKAQDKPDVKPIQLTESISLMKVSSEPAPTSSLLPSLPPPPPPSVNVTSTSTTSTTSTSFTAKLDPVALKFFNDVSQKPFSAQACAFLNAYWPEVGSQAEFIFDVAYEKIMYADRHAKGIQYIHLYEEGSDLDFNIGLYFFEKLCQFVLEDAVGKRWREPQYAMSRPVMMTALVRKQELREKVDVNFDGRVSFLEYLLYQYSAYANPGDFVTRSLANGVEHPEITKARLLLDDVAHAIRAFETEKQRLETEAKSGNGVKALGAQAGLSILNASPLAEKLNQALITAEAAVRIASKKFAGVSGEKGAGGSLWWMQRDLDVKKARYGRG